MFLKTMGFEIRLMAVPGALVGMNQRGVIGFVDRPREPLFGYDLIGRPVKTRLPVAVRQIYETHQDGAELAVNISLSDIDTGDVMLDHGGA